MKLKGKLLWLTLIILIGALLAARLYYVKPAPLAALITQAAGEKSNLTRTANPATPTPVPLRPDMATGMIFPQWGPNAYTKADKNWTQGLKEIKSQTGARWLGLYLQFHQASEDTTQIELAKDGQTPAGLKEGIEMAHKMGYKVYVFPAITLDNAHGWAGYIKYTSDAENQEWFDNYWQQLQPFVAACQEAGCDRFSIGNEDEGLEQSPGGYWHQLLTRVHSAYSGQIVYNINFSTQLKSPIPQWMHDPLLSEIGVSAYYSLFDNEGTVPLAQLPVLWRERVQAHVDDLAHTLGKNIFLSEIGYRNTNHAGYRPYQDTDEGQKDLKVQAALYDAALQNIANDHLIDGIFIWAWSKPPFAPNSTPAAQTIHQWYEKLS
ncbi:hypothetical protein KSC_062620 [Ktedonobacter sp. SOSP1-52]|uniref:glycoside hydrolase family 113 n=1 Tax=Ktedonobacter sp. SOSP1-52 TaxID=2778366 RepID=UPI00191655B3|nr:hypothetical protein [Ktedonobacter sp. SOSP1-52]GHO67370.1 hypothetical protein KSC_062620 [Ktedonobacter sp. SOSP1-52]